MLNSIKLKLVILFLVVFSFFFTGLEIFLYYRLEDLVIHLADEHLTSELETIANLMTVEEAHGQLETELAELSSAVTGMYSTKLSGHYYQIVDAGGRILVKSPSLALADASLPVVQPPGDIQVFRSVTGPDGMPLRVISQTFNFSIGRLTFQAGDSLEDTYELLSSFRNIVLAIFPAVFIICGIGVFVMTGLALRTLKTFSSKVGQITEANLSERIEVRGAPAELKPLASSFNTMLGRLEESFSRQKQFLSDASHELRTPTSIIKSFCDITLSRERQTPDYKDAMKKIGETVNRMCDIINRILVISRLDTKTIMFKPVKMDLRDIMRDVLKLIEPSAVNKGITIRLNGPSVTVKGDREGLTEVFTNIVENAIKYNRPEGKVDIDIKEFHGWASVVIADTGIGIPEGETEKIFDRFYRVDASRGVTVGSGLGLSIVRTIVEAHGGRVDVSSEVGKGTSFTVYIPLNQEFKNTPKT